MSNGELLIVKTLYEMASSEVKVFFLFLERGIFSREY